MTTAPTLEAPAGGDHGAAPAYDKVIRAHGLKIPFVRGPITRRIAVPLRKGEHGAAEVAALRGLLRPGDRVLDLGAGFGLLSAVAATTAGIAAVIAVEANPAFLPVIHETLRLNRARRGAKLIHGAVTAAGDATGSVPFYLRKLQLASSTDAAQAYEATIEVPALSLSSLIAAHRPTVILCDIAGAEHGLFETADLSGVRAVMVRTHPRRYGEAGLAGVERALTGRGLLRQPDLSQRDLRLFRRNERHLHPDAAPWPPKAPRVLVATCMKNEGPFILEWIAWHQAIGVTDFVVYTNDCTDGTDRILDRLAAMGIVTHLENPAVASGSTFFQPEALAHVATLPAFARADFVISMDVDEFINVRVGQGRLDDLFALSGPFDVLSMFEINHGANGQEHYRRGWLKDLFPRHQTERPGPKKAVRGVKSIVRRGPNIQAVRNHRPDIAEGAVWLDGSCRPLPALAEDRQLNGTDCRGGYDLVALDHFALRSLGSYLAKMDRGDVVIKGRQVGERYWRTRNANDAETSSFALADAAARAEHARLMRDDTLSRLHEAACAAHDARIAALLELPEFRERHDWIKREAW